MPPSTIPLAERIEQVETRLRFITVIAVALEDPLATLALVLDARDEASARKAVQERFGISTSEAQAVLDIQFRRATTEQRTAIVRERDQHAEILAHLRRAAEQHAAVAAHYDVRAASYDDSAMHRGLAAAVAEFIAEVAGDPGGTVVDVGTGTGLVLRAIAARWPGTRLVGVDLSAEMLAVAGEALPDAELVRADAATLPVEDGAATVVTCVTALHLLAERDESLWEWHRALRPGGRLVTATFRTAGAPERPDLSQDVVRRHEDFATPQQVAVALEEGFLLEDHTDWTDGTDTLLICVLRRR